MAASQSGLSMEGCSKMFKTFDVALKKSSRHLILSTTYGLNNSWSKKITVGLRLRLYGTFEPVIRLINNSGVSLSVVGWKELVEIFDFVEDYFEKDRPKSENKLSDLMNDTVTLDNCTLRFTSAHGSKVIAFYAKSTDEDAVTENEAEAETDGLSSAKKPKTYSPVIVMQRSIFDGLKNIACCVNAHLSRLEELATDVNRSKDAMVRYFASVVVGRKMKSPTPQQIGVVVWDEAEDAREVVCLQFDTAYRDQYFNIVFSELSRLFMAYIVADIRQSLLTESLPKE